MHEIAHLLPYLVAFSVTLFVTMYTFTQRRRPGAQAFFAVTLSESLWTLGFLLEIYSDSLHRKVLLDLLQFIPSATYTYATLVLCIGLARIELRRPALFWTFMSLGPVLILSYVFTDPLHHQIYGAARLEPRGALFELVYPWPVGMEVGFAWLMAMLTLGLAALGHAIRRMAPLYRRQSLLVLAGLCLPLIGFAFSFMDISIGPHRDTSPFTFAVGNIIIGYALFKEQFLEVIPVAKNKIVDVMQDLAFVTDGEHHLIAMNPAAAAFLLNTKEPPLGRPVGQILSLWPALLETMERLERGVDERALVHLSDRSFELTLNRIARKNQVEGLVFLAHDVTSRLREEQLLQQANLELTVTAKQRATELHQAQGSIAALQTRLQQIVDRLPSCLVGIDPAGRVIHWNDQAHACSGRSALEALGRKVDEVWTTFPKDVERLRASVQDGRVISDTEQMGNAHYAVNVYPVRGGAVLLRDDITAEVNFQNAVIQSEKMVAVGGLAAGMAHEINNPLAGMLQSLQVIEQRLLHDSVRNEEAADAIGISFETVRRYAKERNIEQLLTASAESGRRVTRIVANMLSFARKNDDDMAPVDLRQLLDDTIEIAGTDYNPTHRFDFRQIRIVREYPQGLPSVVCNRSKIQQVILNLLRNGADAMVHCPACPHPRFTVRLSTADEMISMEIEDNGPGMTPEVRSRVFEPFFTTKGTRQGTGLGLSICYYIVTENHNGLLEVESEPGKGTLFRMKLPIGLPG